MHLPSRYTQPSLRTLVALAIGITAGAALLALDTAPRALRVAAGVAVAAALVVAPALSPRVAWHGWIHGEHPALYRFLSRAPREVRIASLTAEADNIPSFAARSVLVSREHSIPYHLGYFRELRRRAIDLLGAQYTRSATELARTLEAYGVDYWILDREAFSPGYVAADPWLQPLAHLAAKEYTWDDQGPPVMESLRARCALFRDGELSILDGPCLRSAAMAADRPQSSPPLAGAEGP